MGDPALLIGPIQTVEPAPDPTLGLLRHPMRNRGDRSTEYGYAHKGRNDGKTKISYYVGDVLKSSNRMAQWHSIGPPQKVSLVSIEEVGKKKGKKGQKTRRAATGRFREREELVAAYSSQAQSKIQPDGQQSAYFLNAPKIFFLSLSARPMLGASAAAVVPAVAGAFSVGARCSLPAPPRPVW